MVRRRTGRRVRSHRPYVYVLEDQQCGGGYLSFALSKAGDLTFKGALAGGPFYVLPKFSGNDKFAYTFVPNEYSDDACPTQTFLGLAAKAAAPSRT